MPEPPLSPTTSLPRVRAQAPDADPLCATTSDRGTTPRMCFIASNANPKRGAFQAGQPGASGNRMMLAPRHHG